MFHVVGKWTEIHELGCLGGLGKIANVLSCVLIGRQLKRRQHTKPVWQKPTPNNRNWPKLRYTLEARFYSLTRLHFYFSYACV